jgi:ribonuclease BN (tRNA processing enzyme)
MSTTVKCPKAIHIDCVSAPGDGLNPSCILTVEGSPLTSQYVFQVPEGLSRFALEHKLRPGLGLRGVFVTGTDHEIHGLPGLLMRLRGDGHGSFELFGPSSVLAYVSAMPRVCSWRTPAVMVTGIDSQYDGFVHNMYEDEHLRIWPVWSTGERNTSLGGGREDAEEGLTRAFVAESKMSKADVLSQLQKMTPSRGSHKHDVFGRSYVKCADVDHGDVWTRVSCEEISKELQNDESSDTNSLESNYESELIGYACFVKGSEQVVIISGYVTEVSERVSKLRRHWLLRGLQSLSQRTNEKITIIIPGSTYSKDSGDLASKEDDMRLIVLSMVGGAMAEKDGVLGFDSTAKTSSRLHVICSYLFPNPFMWRHLRPQGNAEKMSSTEQPGSGAFRITMKPSTPPEYVPYASLSRISSIDDIESNRRKVVEFMNALDPEEQKWLKDLGEKISSCAMARSKNPVMPANNMSAAAHLRQKLLSSRLKKRQRTCETDQEHARCDWKLETEQIQDGIVQKIPGLTAADFQGPYALFLGTGSAEPSKYRGPSGILIKIPYLEDDYMLLECGEGTFGQLVRMFGFDGAMDRVAKLRFIWISHRHADHITGLVELLSRRASGPGADSELFVLGPRACVLWLQSLGSVLNLGHRIRIEHINRVKDKKTYFDVQKRMGAQITCTPVHHCHDSYAISMVFGCRFKLVYSGDTEPCKDLVRDGYGADVLIHEATFEPEMTRDARAKKHSTVQEAIAIANQMKASTTVLTHFSQRYPKFPKISDDDLASDRIAVAFDGFAVLFQAKEHVAQVTRILKKFLMNDEPDARPT